MATRRTEARLVEHWYTLAIALIALAVALGLQGYARHEIGRASTQGTDRSPGVESLAEAGPIIDASQATPRSSAVPAKTIALTFDDGPDPHWTPKILDVLARHHVRATFFVIGSHVATFGNVVKREIADGHDVGNHTFTHIDLLRAPTWQARLELRMTEIALAAATGYHTTLFRPPYSSEPDAVRVDTFRKWRAATQGHYLFALADRDSDDWVPHRTADQIVQSSLPGDERGAVVLMHDGGGNRSATVAALDRLIPILQARGYRFVTVSELARLPRTTVMPRVGSAQRLRSRALPAALTVSSWVTKAFTLFAALVALLALLRASILLGFARRHAWSIGPVDPAFTPFASIVVPAYNEEAGIVAAVQSLADSDYPSFEVIVVDDGSTDRTYALVAELVTVNELSHVTLIHQQNAGKANALNTGIARAQGNIVITVDGDTVFAPDTLQTLVQPFRDERVGAVSGNAKVANRNGVLGRWQHVEYVMGFNLDRRMYDVLGCMPTVPGAVGAFRKDALHTVGGFSDDTLAEDTDITMALHRAGWRVAYEPRALAYTEAPQGLRDLWRQRYRWSYGTMQSVWKHRRAGGRLGRVGLPYLLLFQVALPLLGPAVDLFTLYGLIFLDMRVLALYWCAFSALQVGVAAYALRLDDESMGPLWVVPLQQFVYRQLMYLVVMQSVASALAGVRLRWHKLRRTGITATTRAPSG